MAPLLWRDSPADIAIYLRMVESLPVNCGLTFSSEVVAIQCAGLE